MSGRPTVTLVYEVNCYEDRRTPAERLRDWIVLRRRGWVTRPGYGTLWAMAGRLDEDAGYAEVGRTVVGPLPADQVESALRELQAVLQAAGVDVHTETTADD